MAYCKPALIVLTFKNNLSEKSMIFTKEEKKPKQNTAQKVLLSRIMYR